MPKITLTIEKEIEESGKIKTEKIKVSIPLSVDCMSFRSWVDFHLLLEDWPEWLKQYAALSAKEQVEARADWEEGRQAEYWLELAKVVANFAEGGDLSDVLNIELYQGEPSQIDNIEALSRIIFTAITQYKPSERAEFTHKGLRFVVPGKEVVKVAQYTQTTLFPRVKAGEVIEALQRAHIYGVKKPDGKLAIRDARWHTDLAAVASVCRIVDKNGNVEKIPLGQFPFANFVTDRMQFLEDLPADIAIDVSFFLLNSVTRSLRTASQNSRLKKARQPKQQRRRQRGRRR